MQQNIKIQHNRKKYAQLKLLMIYRILPLVYWGGEVES